MMPWLGKKQFSLFSHLGVVLVAGLGAGCASPPPAAPPASTEQSVPDAPPAQGAQPPDTRPAKPANLNLRGFPVAFREGYAAGCDSGRDGGRRRDEARYKADMNYMMGWNDGYSICAPRK